MNNLMYVFLMYLLFFCTAPVSGRVSAIIDADTGNEMDDLYAVAHAVVHDSFKVIGLTSAHFNNPQLVTDEMWHIYPTRDINTLEISQELNEKLLSILNRNSIPHPRGCGKMVGYAWGYYPGAQIPNSDAVRFIIEQAKQHSPEHKLNILCLGAVTNVAAAVLRDSSIVPSIRLYALTMKYDVERHVWNKNSFNANNDRNGLDVVLNTRGLELVIMPGNVSRELVFERERTLKKLGLIDVSVTEIFKRRWDEVSAGESWIMWDLALIEAVLHPELAVLETRTTPPENTPRPVSVYLDIDETKMKQSFWRTLKTLQ
ncbi:MAG: nucleoside hydrolase [candidate division KSB1 bacterium]|nr:nucleoside hydrolase [candidate division KSB1 bacterium]